MLLFGNLVVQYQSLYPGFLLTARQRLGLSVARKPIRKAVFLRLR